MDLVYTTYNLPGGRSRIPPWIRETNSLCSVSSQNLILYSSVLPSSEGGAGVNRIYCSDLNTPWDHRC